MVAAGAMPDTGAVAATVAAADLAAPDKWECTLLSTIEATVTTVAAGNTPLSALVHGEQSAYTLSKAVLNACVRILAARVNHYAHHHPHGGGGDGGGGGDSNEQQRSAVGEKSRGPVNYQRRKQVGGGPSIGRVLHVW